MPSLNLHPTTSQSPPPKSRLRTKKPLQRRTLKQISSRTTSLPSKDRRTLVEELLEQSLFLIRTKRNIQLLGMLLI